MDLAENDFQRAICILNTKRYGNLPQKSSKIPAMDKYNQRWREILQDFYIKLVFQLQMQMACFEEVMRLLCTVQSRFSDTFGLPKNCH